MTVDHETLMAFIDGELSPEDARRIADAIAGDASLSAYVERQKALKARLAGAFDPILTVAVPERLKDTIARSTPRVRARPSRWRLWDMSRPWFPAAALAAGLAIGIVVSAPSMLATRDDGALIARGELANSLSDRLASDYRGGDAVRVGVSFARTDGTLCRAFSTSGTAPLAGIACRTGSDWRVEILTAAASSDPNAFQPAAASMPPLVRDAIADMIAGEPLDADAERSARASGWSAR